MGNQITICHWDNGGHWNALEISTSALEGHDNHDMDIWPPVEDLTQGQNWPKGETVYLNGCVLAASPEPTPSGTATGTPTELPPTGAELWIAPLSLILIGAGMYAQVVARRRRSNGGKVAEPPDM